MNTVAHTPTAADTRTIPFFNESGSRLMMTEGSLAALKWFALCMMLADHINKYFFSEQLPGLFLIGRVVMPIFAFVLSYNLTRPGALEGGVHRRLIGRLFVFGLVATPPMILLNQSVFPHYPWWPLDILFTLALFVVLAYLLEKGGFARTSLALALFVVGGAMVEYLWIGILVCLAAWFFCRRPTWRRFALWCLAVFSLVLINSNTWALFAIPLIVIASRISFTVPRSKWVFYGFYPFHLFVLCLLKLG